MPVGETGYQVRPPKGEQAMAGLKTSVALALGALISTSGCSLLIGPNQTPPTKDDISKSTNEDWIVFTTIDEAQVSVRGAETWFRDRALNRAKTADSGSDVVVTTLIAGTVAGATGSPTGARIGAGLASLFGFGVDRYKLEAQHDIFVKAADAYGCVGRAIDGLDSAILNVPLSGLSSKEKLSADEMNERRVTVVSDVRNVARDIQRSFEAAMFKVKLVQPDLSALESAIKEKAKKSEETPAPAMFSIANQSALMFAPGAAVAGAPPPGLIDQLRSDFEVERANLRLEQAKVERNRLRGAPQPLIDAANRNRDQAEGAFRNADAALKSALYANRGQNETDRMMLMVVRLRTLNEQLNICKALVSGGT
jgi:hypothetical protein